MVSLTITALADGEMVHWPQLPLMSKYLKQNIINLFLQYV